ncbi:hypothetical protein [Polyangium spumosum]|uniref:DUF3619 family protein n=1 Tax=Polyangium spumosum TaxID=889282 RepID=A0A6N7PJF9_9BACT|nr:hypothetical protein [Polyangium spumosum]MRG92128.1 hypothetical protein [Polyangium spumosum]
MAEHDRDPLSNLEALARETDDLRPTDELTDALLRVIEAPDDRLARLTQETSDLAPSDDFAASVMAAIGETSGARRFELPWSSGVVRFGRLALVSAAAAAALALWLSQTAENRYDSTVLEAVAAVEVYE